MGFSRVSIRGCMRLSFITGVAAALSALCAISLRADTITQFDADLAKRLGDAAAKSEAVAIVLGFVCVACLGLAWKMVQKRDEDRVSHDKDREATVALTLAIQEQNLLQKEAHKDSLEAVRVASEAANCAAQAAQTAAAVALQDKKDINERAAKQVEAIGRFATKPCAFDSDVFRSWLKGILVGDHK